MNNPIITLEGVEKRFGNNHVVKNMNLEIAEGEFLTLLGPSGCGKTTTLRMIAGFEEASSGIIKVEGERIEDKEPFQRNVNTVFQNYALFPHMSVADNVGYGLKIRKVPKSEIQRKVKEMLELVQLEEFEKRKPSELSGGQKQRVAIARALVNNPKVLLLDEPLGALDLQLRRTMQSELKKLQKRLGITFIYITHDQEEAINMSDRIVVMNQGVFEQIGCPDEVYNHPKTSFVATFVGNANIIKGVVERVVQDKALVVACKGKALVDLNGETLRPGEQVTLAVRSENISLDEDCGCGLEATVEEKTFSGGLLRMVLRAEDGSTLVSSRYGIDANVQVGQKVCFRWESNQAVLVDRG